MQPLEEWLAELGLSKYAETLARNDIDLDVLPDLTDGDLERLGLSLGHRRKVLSAAARLRSAGVMPASLPDQSGDTSQQVERRQVTVLFSDLVGSTALSGELDPEDLNLLLRDFQERCAAAIARHGGFVAKFLGDGVLAYFGYPVAYEHAAEFAVRAGLDIVQETGTMRRPDGRPLESRVGIATGLVVVGELIGSGASQERSIVGDTPNLAARLQALAQPGWVVTSESTQRLAGHFFDLDFLGEHPLKGFPQPIPAWRALSAREVESRFAATSIHDMGSRPLLGRDRELADAIAYWKAACEGKGHAILLSGDPGMGKSRLLEAVTAYVESSAHRILRCQCSPYHITSALYPINQLLRRAADIRADRSAAVNLAALSTLLKARGLGGRRALLLIAETLEIPRPEDISPMEMTKAQRKSETLALIARFIFGADGDKPTLLLIEDAHWIDPTTQELLDDLYKRIGSQRTLAIITHRQEYKPTWAEMPQATTIVCNRLDAQNCAVMVRNIAKQSALSDTVIDEIVRRSDGVPLFVEELTKAVIETKTVRTANVPATLQDSLMSRLDRLGYAKDVAQIASVIGRHFQMSLLSEIADTKDASLAAALTRLVESGLVLQVRDERDPGGAYNFNHSLVQEAAYESLLKTRRQVLHARIARILERRLNELHEGVPDLVAHHFSKAGLHTEACTYWVAAAELAGSRSAYAESIACLGHALAAAGQIADSSLRQQAMLKIQLNRGTTYFIQKGPLSPDVESAMTEARALAQQIDPGQPLFQATWGLYLNALTTRRFELARHHVDDLVAISKHTQDDVMVVESLHHQWGYAMFVGHNRVALRYALEGEKVYVPERHHHSGRAFAGHDVGVCAKVNIANSLGLLAELQDAHLKYEEAVSLAESLHHPMSIQFAFGNANCVSYVMGHLDPCEDYSRRQLEIATRYDFSIAAATAEFFLAACAAQRREKGAHVERMEQNFQSALKYGFTSLLPGAMLAEVMGTAGRNRAGLDLLNRLLDSTRDPEIGLYMSELWRLRGELTLAESRDEKALGEQYLRRALAIATQQESGLLRLRAALGLARVLADQGRDEDAKAALTSPLADLPVSCDSPERRDAERVLAQLA